MASADLEPALRLIGFVAFLVAATGLLHLHIGARRRFSGRQGGILGQLVGDSLIDGFRTARRQPVPARAVAGGGHAGDRPVVVRGDGSHRPRRACAAGAVPPRHASRRADDWNARARCASEREEVVRKVDTELRAKREPVKIEPPAPRRSRRAIAPSASSRFRCSMSATRDGDLPPLSLLDEPKPQPKGYAEETLETLSRQVEFKLKDFRIDAQVVGAYPGPVITRFEMQPAPGIKGSQIQSSTRTSRAACR